MRKTLQRRLAHLERRAGINVDPPRVRLVTFNFVSPNDPKPGEPNRADAYGRVWHREAGETPEAFQGRVIAAQPRSSPKILHLFRLRQRWLTRQVLTNWSLD